MQIIPMTVAETPTFTREAESLLTEEERNDLTLFLAENPESGRIIEHFNFEMLWRLRRQTPAAKP